jgi:holo-[acyl-carrier protein] synthase
MNLLGHGIDLVDIASFQRWVDDPRDPLIPRCFVHAELTEIGHGPDRIERLAGRFAAKEAVLKALGSGFGAGIAFSDVHIFRDPGRQPTVQLSGGAAQLAAARGISSWHLSISHAGGMAMASALALGPEPDSPDASARGRRDQDTQSAACPNRS